MIDATVKNLSGCRDNDVRMNSLTSGADTIVLFLEDTFYSLVLKKQIDAHAALKLVFSEGKLVKVVQLVATE